MQIHEPYDYVLFLAFSCASITAAWLIFKKKFQVNILNKTNMFFVLLVFSLGYVFVNHQGEKVWTLQINELKTMVPTYAEALRELNHQTLDEKTSVTDENYLRIIKQEIKWLSLNPRISDIYTLKRINLQNRFIVDSETDYNRDGIFDNDREVRTQIGEPYEKMQEEIKRTFKGEITYTEKPYQDKWGKWVSVLAPIYDQQQNVDAVLGIDYSAEELINKKEDVRRLYIYYLLGIVLSIFFLSVPSAFLKREIQLKNSLAKELITAQEQQIKSAKFSVLGEMSAGIAHEINNPLAIISGNTEIIKQEITKQNFDQNKVLILLTKIDSTIQRIAKIVKGLKTFSRSNAQDPKEYFSITNCMQDTLDLCSEKLKNHGVSLSIENFPQSDMFHIHGHSVQISQVILNLINNSFDAISHKEEKWIKILFDQDSSYCYIRIIDSGTGIPEHIQQNLMQPFFTTKEVGKGTGLGLSISKGIMENHQGELYYDKSSHHTAFIIKLPKAKNQQAAA
jgi:signal transduction histidine kinase